ncbi:hypothetical protein WMY93_030831 [Mugilogobius chulae]|uniref:Nematode cuticle collagen N-terminal domain-containing protein n=1 Tax=Mugilogobius chulae TaxID=88201 RepID=A0AAW0MP56_9GOBI
MDSSKFTSTSVARLSGQELQGVSGFPPAPGGGPAVLGAGYGPDVCGVAAVVSVMLLFLTLYGVCVKLPSSRTLVSDLKKNAGRLNDTIDLLKRRVEAEVWVRSMSSRWSSVEELQKRELMSKVLWRLWRLW